MAWDERGNVVGIFDDFTAAETAIDELWHAGFPHEDIGFIGPKGEWKEAQTPIGKREDRAATGAIAGAVTGTAVGAIAGAAVISLIPGIGQVLAGGLIAAAVGSAATGAAVGSYLGPFVAMGLGKEEAERYGSELKAGRTIVVVKAGDRYAEAETTLRDHGGRAPGIPADQRERIVSSLS